MSIARLAALPLAALAFSSPAQAEVIDLNFSLNDLYDYVTITFNGTVTETARDNFMVSESAGNYVPYTGSLPDIGVNVGDAFSTSMVVVLPNLRYYNEYLPLMSPGYEPRTNADGLYVNNVSPFQPFPADFEQNFFKGGPESASSPFFVGGDNLGQDGVISLRVAMDPNTGQYYIDHETPRSDGTGVFMNYFRGPGYIYDAASSSYLPCGTGIGSLYCGEPFGERVLFSMVGNADGTEMRSQGVKVGANAGNEGYGYFNWAFSGSWSLPSLSSRGGPTEVPAPGMLLLFGAGALGVFARRRRGGPKAAA